MSIENPSKVTKWITVLIFFLIAFSSSIVFLKSLTNLIGNLFFNDGSYFIFRRGDYFLLGVSAASFLLVYIFGYETVKNIPLPKDKENIVIKMVVFSVSLIFILPLLITLLIGVYSEKKGYIECDIVSGSGGWPVYKTIYYAASNEICQKLTEEYENTRYKPKYKVKSSNDNIVLP